MNQHVNNTRYVDWFMNQFPVEKHRRQMLGDLLGITTPRLSRRRS